MCVCVSNANLWASNKVFIGTIFAHLTSCMCVHLLVNWQNQRHTEVLECLLCVSIGVRLCVLVRVCSNCVNRIGYHLHTHVRSPGVKCAMKRSLNKQLTNEVHLHDKAMYLSVAFWPFLLLFSCFHVSFILFQWLYEYYGMDLILTIQ